MLQLIILFKCPKVGMAGWGGEGGTLGGIGKVEHIPHPNYPIFFYDRVQRDIFLKHHMCALSPWFFQLCTLLLDNSRLKGLSTDV